MIPERIEIERGRKEGRRESESEREGKRKRERRMDLSCAAEGVAALSCADLTRH